MEDPTRDRPGAIPAPSKERRWDIDDRGDGLHDASKYAERIAALREHAQRPRWVAEEPDVHLWPHIERAIAADGSLWAGVQWSIDADGWLVVELRHLPLEGDRARADLHAEVMRLLGHVVESSTYVEIAEHLADGTLVVDVVTGLQDDQTPFKAHGHTIRFRVTTSG